MKEGKHFKVSAIKNGTVIDHIPSKTVFKVISILNLDKLEDKMITFGSNFESKKLGSKGIIKISDKYFDREDIDKISLIAPQAKISIIKDYEVVHKEVVEIPDKIVGIVKCINPNCISNHEKIQSKFLVLSKEDVSLKCHYCEKITSQTDLNLI
ncbi:MAG: aspartate carbamoyltransferase regulatory subunit [Bacteroidales bacterium]|nr:aspartate carbamoyltransferase regulatory subunit [Bacteroidales bacterium]